MRLKSLLLCALMVLAATFIPASTASAVGVTPGTYVNYTFGSPSLTQAEFRMTINASPGKANVYWANQFGFTAGSVGGYTGMQTHRDGVGMFIYSLWNSTDWRAGDAGTYCIRFQEDGTGGSCRLDQTPVAGHTYAFAIASEGSGWYGVTVRDLTAGTSFKLGSLQTGAGNTISTSGMVSWTEYFDWNNDRATCDDEPYSKLSMTAPTSGTQTAQFTGTSESSGCAADSQVTISGSTAVQENGIGNSSSGEIRGSGGCLDVSGSDGTTILLYSCTGGNNQNWVHAENNTLHALFSCLDASATQASAVILYSCHGGTNQQWTQPGDGTIRSNGLCLTAPATLGSKVTVAQCNNSATQRWTTPA
ncbi:ricin-type beta-trefoil lectin domain protein [Kribbella sp. NBC_01245]|uniref:ricin-type beta-trefoil lectin domain protein n=1 Tax=Kribbella sp. NBC_01245 TaxID=2903578 RepID=UPI002E294847|nr:ricin-type beta-trefoil lectin domain protein [Kribbella sp. NBC_01245]